MVRRILVVIIAVAAIITAMWAFGVFRGILPDPPLDDLDGIAVVTGTIYDASTLQPLTLVLVSCGQIQDYTGSGSTYRLEVQLDNPRGCGGLISADVSSDYYLGHVSVELSDLTPAQGDIYVEAR